MSRGEMEKLTKFAHYFCLGVAGSIRGKIIVLIDIVFSFTLTIILISTGLKISFQPCASSE
jgi:hypothetical protein